MNEIQIIATIGPACKDHQDITELVQRGMSIARLNFSWGTHDEHQAFVDTIRAVADEQQTTVPIIQDLSGPRVQQGAGHTYDVGASVITDKDRSDLLALAEKQPEYVALSFVKSASDVTELRELITAAGSHSKIIAKIERQEALQAIDEIIAAADGIMIARGDLGDAVPYETVPFVKKDVLQRCRAAHKPAVVATELLTSMIASEKPNRADVSDIAQAVLDGASATMLSNETAVGEHSAAAVSVMRTVVNEAQKHTTLSVAPF